jgi:putative hydrolases of HD superfamily
MENAMNGAGPEVLAQHLRFLTEIDRLKSVLRQSPLIDQSRKENSAEHSWHLAMYALVLAPYARHEVDVLRVVKMLLLHDIVEIDAGDTPIHGAVDAGQHTREAAAALRLFGLLPEPHGAELHALWEEFERSESNDSLFAKALDRLQPLVINVSVGGGTWNDHGVTYEQVLQRYGPVIERGAPALWDFAKPLVAKHFNRSGPRDQ